MGKHDSDRDYHKGYHDGSSGKSYPDQSVIETVVGAMPGFPSGNKSRDYDEGFRDGREDSRRK